MNIGINLGHTKHPLCNSPKFYASNQVNVFVAEPQTLKLRSVHSRFVIKMGKAGGIQSRAINALLRPGKSREFSIQQISKIGRTSRPIPYESQYCHHGIPYIERGASPPSNIISVTWHGRIR